MDQAVTRCLGFFSTRSIKVRREWCEACIEWISEENNGMPTLEELKNLVYEQWLLADLREIAAPAFPSNISEKKGSYTHQGQYCVQVNKIVDIGHSAYSQLSKIKGCEIDDEDEEEDGGDLKQFFKGSNKNNKKPAQNTKWQKKETFTRMFLLELSDGHETVEAIEYQPIRELSIDDVAPGCKLSLIGPLMSRDGLLFLKSQNVKVLGGSVEELQETASHLTQLCHILSIEGEDKEKIDNEMSAMHTIVPQSDLQNNDARAQNTQNKPPNKSQNKSQNKNNEKILDEDAFDDDLFLNDVFDDIGIDDLDDIDDFALSQAVEKQSAKKKRNSSTNVSSKSSGNDKGNRTKSNTPNPLQAKRNNPNLLQTKRNTPGPSRNRQEPAEKKVKEEIDIDLVDDDIFLNDSSFFNTSSNVKAEEEPPHSPSLKSSVTKDYIEDRVFKCGLNEEDTKSLDVSIGDETNEITITLPDIIKSNEPIMGVLSLKAWFTTLTSTLSFKPTYRLSAIITDGENFLEILLGDKVLTELVGFSAKQVQDATTRKLSNEKIVAIKNAIKKAEKSLETERWNMKMEFDTQENVYVIVQMDLWVVSLDAPD